MAVDGKTIQDEWREMCILPEPTEEHDYEAEFEKGIGDTLENETDNTEWHKMFEKYLKTKLQEKDKIIVEQAREVKELKEQMHKWGKMDALIARLKK